MAGNRILGFVLLVVGATLLFVGINSSNSVVDQVSNTVTGRFTQTTTWYIIGGIAVALWGLLMMMLGPRSRPS